MSKMPNDAIDEAIAIFLPCIKAHRESSQHPFVLGLSGLQGSGKSTWAAALAERLTTHYQLNTRSISLDDFYLDRADLADLRKQHPGNKLLRVRGQPGTHDRCLAQAFFGQLERTGESNNSPQRHIAWPRYDKSLHNGTGGRCPAETWELVPTVPTLHVLIFEGWCLGFQPLDAADVTHRWREAASSHLSSKDKSPQKPTATLQHHELEHLLLVNENLARYCQAFMGPWRFHSFLHLTTADLQVVYDWRLDQESALKAQGKPGMDEFEVLDFVQGYMPAYELYLPSLQNGSLYREGEEYFGLRKHAQVILGGQRQVLAIKEL